MLKKKIAIVFAAAMMTLSASSAFAAFADQELIRVVYDRAGIEIATDMGNVKTILAAPSTSVAGNLSTGKLVAYFALDRATGELWASNVNAATATFTPAIIGGGTGLTAIKSGTTVMYSQYNTQGGTTYNGLAADANSYKNKLSATQGFMGNTITAANNARTFTELSLSTLATNNTQTLYYWKNGLTTVAADKIGKAVATITTNANGTSNVTTTPIPAAFYLMGSGLMGLVGLRRRNKA